MDLSPYRSVAHRGIHDKLSGIPENSLPAFRKAMEAGIAIELDVHLTRDGQVVVFHDDNLKRMTGLDRMIDDCTCADLAPLRLLGTDCGIPLMSRVLQLVGGRVPLLVELKDNGFSGELPVALLELLSTYRGEYLLQSFNPWIICWLRKNAPKVKRGQLSQRSFEGSGAVQLAKKHFLGSLVFNWMTKPDFIAYNIHDLKPKQAKMWKEKGYGLLAWTVRTEGDLRKARWLCDGAIFESLPVDQVKR